MSVKVDHEECRQLLLDIDENGTNLSRGEIDDIADLIDRRVRIFSPDQYRRLKDIHDTRVVNGRPESD